MTAEMSKPIVKTPRRARRTGAEVVTVAADRAPKSERKQAVSVADSVIASRAYALYLARGCQHGHDVEDWLRAEGELRGKL
jgi:hypothetical protein